MSEFEQLVASLKKQEEVDAVFLTGSHAQHTHTAWSDLDIVIILTKNTHDIRTVYEWVDGMFADIFLFDRADLQRIEVAAHMSANSMDAILVTWLGKASVLFDKSGHTTSLAHSIEALAKRTSVPASEKDDIWRRINHNWVNNTRYFNSHDSLYVEALEIRLQNSVTELIVGYLTLHGEPWRGEKAAVVYLQGKAPVFYDHYKKYLAAHTVGERYTAYTDMVSSINTTEFPLWRQGDIVITQVQGTSMSQHHDELHSYWIGLTRERESNV